MKPYNDPKANEQKKVDPKDKAGQGYDQKQKQPQDQAGHIGQTDKEKPYKPGQMKK